MIIKGIIEKRKLEEGTGKTGKPYTRVIYTIAEKNYSTFDDKLFGFKEGDNVEMETEQKGQYQNMVSMKIVENKAVSNEIPHLKPIPQEFHQSPEVIRYEALDIALKYLAFEGGKPKIEEVFIIGELIEKWIKGEVK